MIRLVLSRSVRPAWGVLLLACFALRAIWLPLHLTLECHAQDASLPHSTHSESPAHDHAHGDAAPHSHNGHGDHRPGHEHDRDSDDHDAAHGHHQEPLAQRTSPGLGPLVALPLFEGARAPAERFAPSTVAESPPPRRVRPLFVPVRGPPGA